MSRMHDSVAGWPRGGRALRSTVSCPVAYPPTIIASGGLHSLFNGFDGFRTIAGVVAGAVTVVTCDVGAGLRAIAVASTA